MLRSLTTIMLLLAPGAAAAADQNWALAVHGGAGVASRSALTPEREAEIRAVLNEALAAGGAILKSRGSSEAAVEAAVRVLEDSPFFNAGRGAALDETGMARHDAAIMRGRDHAVGAIAGSTRIRNPISAARALMESDGAVLLAGEGADWFAARKGLELADPLWFQTDERRDALIRQRARDAKATQEAALADAERFGTVGAVARDQAGNVAVATSTGGRTNKPLGRIGDSPLIGAGTYASSAGCAVSATGHGEYFIRWTVARDVCARVELKGETIGRAASAVIDALKGRGGDGAVIAIDRAGDVAFAMNGRGMYRGKISATTTARTGIYAEDAVK